MQYLTRQACESLERAIAGFCQAIGDVFLLTWEALSDTILQIMAGFVDLWDFLSISSDPDLWALPGERCRFCGGPAAAIVRHVCSSCGGPARSWRPEFVRLL